MTDNREHSQTSTEPVLSTIVRGRARTPRQNSPQTAQFVGRFYVSLLL